MTVAWRPNPTAPLWYEERRGEPVGPFFHDLSLQHTRQVGPSCVATTLSMVANATGAQTTPEDFKAVTNSQAPHTWSQALKPYGLQLAYCNNDVRRLGYFVDELVAYDDLFFLCFYSEDPPSDRKPRGNCARLTSSRCTATPSTTRPSRHLWAVCARPRITADWKGRPRESSGSSRSIIRGASDEHGCQEKSASGVRRVRGLRSAVWHRFAH